MANSYFTAAQILSYAEGSIYYATNDKLKGQLFSPRINPKLPTILDIETASLRWAYNQGGENYPGIQQVANYVYDLCGVYALKARNASGGGGIPVIPVTPGGDNDCTGLEVILASQFQADGKTYYNPAWANKNLTIFWNNIPRYILPPDWIPVVGGGFKIVTPSDFDAFGNNADAVFVVAIGCFNPGMIINPTITPINTEVIVTGQDTYLLTWTDYLRNAYGKGSFQVLQYDGTEWIATSITGIPDDIDNPTIYTFSNLSNLNTRIIIS